MLLLKEGLGTGTSLVSAVTATLLQYTSMSSGPTQPARGYPRDL